MANFMGYEKYIFGILCLAGSKVEPFGRGGKRTQKAWLTRLDATDSEMFWMPIGLNSSGVRWAKFRFGFGFFRTELKLFVKLYLTVATVFYKTVFSFGFLAIGSKNRKFAY